MKSRFSLILIICAVIFGGILFATKKDSKSTSGGNDSAQATNITRGGGKSGVVITEYADFQCPACGAYYPVVEQVYEKYQDQVTFQFRHFPLRQIHQHAMVSHRAAEAANKQGKFWEMFSLLYRNQQTWSVQTDPTSTFRGFAESLGLDMAKYDADFKSEAVNDTLNADIAEGQKLGVTGTPTFFIDGKKIENPRDADAFNKVIEDAIKAKTQPQ
jgi:protein-disulfide isomerase